MLTNLQNFYIFSKLNIQLVFKNTEITGFFSLYLFSKFIVYVEAGSSYMHVNIEARAVSLHGSLLYLPRESVSHPPVRQLSGSTSATSTRLPYRDRQPCLAFP